MSLATCLEQASVDKESVQVFTQILREATNMALMNEMWCTYAGLSVQQLAAKPSAGFISVDIIRMDKILITNTPFWYQNYKFEMEALKLRDDLDLVSGEAELLLQIPSSVRIWFIFSFFNVSSSLPCIITTMKKTIPDSRHHPTLTSRQYFA